jgi:integrase
VYLTQQWLPSKQVALRPSTWASYRNNIELHIVPAIGRVPLRHLRPDHIERLYANLLADGNSVRPGGLDGKTVLEIHMVLRRALTDAQRRGMIVANPAAIAHAPKRRPLASATPRAWNAHQLRTFLDLSADHRLHAALWVSANTGVRRGELLGLRWGDIELDTARMSVSRSLVSVGYEIHESHGKTRTARRCIDLDQRTIEVLRQWRKRRCSEDAVLKAGVPIKVVSERLGHATPAFTMATYQHVLPGMQAEAAQTFAELLELLPASTR